MKSRIYGFFGAVVGTLLAWSPAAMAGLVQTQLVEVTLNADGSGSAIGNMSSARLSANRVEYVGCGIRYSTSTTGTYKYGWCQANSAGNVAGFCSVDSSQLLEAIAGLAHNSFITFGWNAAGVCTRIGMSTQSFYAP